MLGAALRDPSRHAPNGSNDGILSQILTAQQSPGACLEHWGGGRMGWRLGRACPSIQEGSRREQPRGGLKGEKMVTDGARSERSVSPVFQQGLD